MCARFRIIGDKKEDLSEKCFYELENKVDEQLVSRCDRSSINYFLYNDLPSIHLTCQFELMLGPEYLFLTKYS